MILPESFATVVVTQVISLRALIVWAQNCKRKLVPAAVSLSFTVSSVEQELVQSVVSTFALCEMFAPFLFI